MAFHMIFLIESAENKKHMAELLKKMYLVNSIKYRMKMKQKI
jgi:hypothetical protein